MKREQPEELVGIVIGPEEGEKLARGPRHHRILTDLPELEVIELRFGPEFEGVDPHSHADHVDAFCVLEGEAEFTLGDQARPGRPRHVRRHPDRGRPRIPACARGRTPAAQHPRPQHRLRRPAPPGVAINPGP